jgi:NAD(P) transhydrogenase subunit beta
MSKAMNRSFANVLFGAFGTQMRPGSLGRSELTAKSYNEATVEDAGAVLKASQSVIFVPGYGMAVSQAQHAVRDLAASLERRGVDVKYAIHPVAGRMPGHMNVLLAEANVPYDELYDLDDINDDFAAHRRGAHRRRERRREPGGEEGPVEPDLRHARVQRGAGAVGHRAQAQHERGVQRRGERALLPQPNTMMVLGDAKKTLLAMISELKEGGH